jgi:hypothetical protein
LVLQFTVLCTRFQNPRIRLAESAPRALGASSVNRLSYFANGQKQSVTSAAPEGLSVSGPWGRQVAARAVNGKQMLRGK